jgi:hypothetical protein
MVEFFEGLRELDFFSFMLCLSCSPSLFASYLVCCTRGNQPIHTANNPRSLVLSFFRAGQLCPMVKAALGVPTTTALHPRHWVTKETDHENISKGNEENCTRVRSKTNSEPQPKMVRSTETVHKKKSSKKQTTKVQTCQLQINSQ